MTAKMPRLLFAALLCALAACADDGDRVRTGAAGVDDEPSPAVVAALARSQGLPQNQPEQVDSSPPPAQAGRARRGRGRVYRARRAPAPVAAPAESAPQ